MPILEFPDITPATTDWMLQSNTQAFTSPLSRTTQTAELPGARWMASISFPPLEEDDWKVLTAFLAQLRGQAGRFYFGPPHYQAPSDALGAPMINGGGQTGTSLITDGWLTSISVRKKGEYISFDTPKGRELHMIVEDAVSDAVGNATLTLEPPIRTAPADNAVITIDRPTCIMKLVDDNQGKLSVSQGLFGQVSLDLVEVF